MWVDLIYYIVNTLVDKCALVMLGVAKANYSFCYIRVILAHKSLVRVGSGGEWGTGDVALPLKVDRVVGLLPRFYLDPLPVVS